jgi:hypothetical protein
VYLNAAITANDVRREVDRLTGDAIRVVYGVFDLIQQRVRARPVGADGDGPGPTPSSQKSRAAPKTSARSASRSPPPSPRGGSRPVPRNPRLDGGPAEGPGTKTRSAPLDGRRERPPARLPIMFGPSGAPRGVAQRPRRR